jgi:hypothetical protein
MCLSVRGFCPKTSTSVQTTLAAEEHLAKGQFFLAEDTLNMGKSMICRTGTRRPTISKKEEEQWIKQRIRVMSPLYYGVHI